MKKPERRFAVGAMMLAVAVLVGGGLAAAPRLDLVSVRLVNGSPSELVLSGVAFGTKNRPAPIKWDDFDHGSAGEVLSGWSSESAGGEGHYSSARLHSPGLSARFYFTRGSGENAYIGGLGATELYVSYWVYIDHLNGDVSRNIKLARVSAIGPDLIHGEPNVGYTSLSETSGQFYNNSLSAGYSDVVWQVVTPNAWHRVTYWTKLSSSPGKADGKRQFHLDGIRVTRNATYDDNAITLPAGATQTTFNAVVLGEYVAHDPGGDYAIHYDDVYVDNTRARVEVCNVASWPSGSAAAHCEIQEPVSWSDTSITVRFNLGSFPSASGLYAYVVDAAGNANAAGVPLTGTGGAVGPRAPTGVSVIR